MKSKLTFIIILSLMVTSTFPMSLVDAKKRSRTYSKYRSSKKQKTNTYKVPRRAITITPYASIIYAKDLYKYAIKDQPGFGGGLNIRNQITWNFGYMLDACFYNLEVLEGKLSGAEEEEEANVVSIYTAGFYYTYEYLRFDLCYGAIKSGINIMTIFAPGVEYHKKLFNRILLFTRARYLITNDWIDNQEYKEYYTTFSLSGGFSVIF